MNHHPSDATLMAYAGGALSEGLALVVAAHISLCRECGKHAAEAEAVGGVLLSGLAPAAMSVHALDAVMGRLDSQVSEPRQASLPRAPIMLDGMALPDVLTPYLAEHGHSDPWRFLAPGIRQIELLTKGRNRSAARLFKFAPGTTLPHHGHHGDEMTVVLSGSYSDEIGRFAAGDLADLDEETEHQPIADTDVECICLIATNAPLRFTGLFNRLLQPFIGL